MKVRQLRRIYDIKKIDFWLSFLVLAGVLISGILSGLVIAVIASMLARVHGTVQDVLKRISLKEMIEEGRVFNTVSDTVLEFKNKYK